MSDVLKKLRDENQRLRELADAADRAVLAIEEMHVRDVAMLRAALKEACDLGHSGAAYVEHVERFAQLRKLTEEP